MTTFLKQNHLSRVYCLVLLVIAVLAFCRVTPVAAQNEVGGTESAGIVWDRHHSNGGFPVRSQFGAVLFDADGDGQDEMWVIGGQGDGVIYNDAWYSTNGRDWIAATQSAPWSPRSHFTAVTYDHDGDGQEEIWIFSGKSAEASDVWYSSDGANWIRATADAPWVARQAYEAIVYDNKMWIMGGFDGTADRNDVWYSTDGVNWTEATATAPWGARNRFSSVVFDHDNDGNSEMWVIGGRGPFHTTNTVYADVWKSSDGVNWTQVTNFMTLGPRREHSSVVFDNKVWIIGGDISLNQGDKQDDVWWSEDGANWTQATANAAWDASSGHETLVYNADGFDRIWNLGGRTSGNIARQTAWHDMRDHELLPHHFAATNVPVEIQSPKGRQTSRTTTSSIFVDQHLSIADLNLTFDISHTFDANLTISLIHTYTDENGALQETTVQLFSGVGGSGDNFSGTTIDDEVRPRISDANPPFAGTFRPSNYLRKFDEQDAYGNWTLEIIDSDKFDDGTLNSWSLDFFGTPLTSEPPTNNSATYASSDTPLSIPDNDIGGVASDVIAEDHTITALTITLDITHPRPSDLEVYLIDPTGSTAIQLFNYSGDNPVPDFNGSSSLGIWTLEVYDMRNKKKGTLNAWSITIDY